MIQGRIQNYLVIGFVALFFVYLFGPLIVMGLTAFNTSGFPRVSPWDCFTVEWFDVLMEDTRLVTGVRNSLLIGIGVVILAVPIGLAGALMLMQIGPRLRPWLYTVTISPILVPGVVLGISTLLFWDRIGLMFGAGEDTIFYDGVFLTIVGQATFISAYAMLIFIARLQRFDPALEEAALDLGASHTQTFRKILLPFLRPAIGSAAVLAFLASFENYNTTIFTIVSSSTLTTVLASKVRYGIDPSISALAVSIVFLTLVGAVLYEISKRREARRAKAQMAVARGEAAEVKKQRPYLTEPAFIIFVLIVVAGLGTVYFSGTIGVEECKIAVKEQRQAEIKRKVERRQQQQMFQSAIDTQGQSSGDQEETREESKVTAKGTEGYQSVFSPGNLQGETESQAEEEQPVKGTEGYQDVFSPGNLVNTTSDEPEEEKPVKGTEGYQNVFAPENLTDQVPAENSGN
ncbi:MAG: ABC transporter permease subunit [Gammaproteobacteria bacterium]|nr:ABC transporter permease subunit [Gammaproteobacteria bacterium]